mmetsp:Transcript_16974/g.38110  ORF Transcript_16974/g.38110 Transcript_16974/m.38110 type:complete len:143 (+) Transcript_16974:1236-1664(+)
MRPAGVSGYCAGSALLYTFCTFCCNQLVVVLFSLFGVHLLYTQYRNPHDAHLMMMMTYVMNSMNQMEAQQMLGPQLYSGQCHAPVFHSRVRPTRELSLRKEVRYSRRRAYFVEPRARRPTRVETRHRCDFAVRPWTWVTGDW